MSEVSQWPILIISNYLCLHWVLILRWSWRITLCLALRTLNRTFPHDTALKIWRRQLHWSITAIAAVWRGAICVECGKKIQRYWLSGRSSHWQASSVATWIRGSSGSLWFSRCQKSFERTLLKLRKVIHWYDQICTHAPVIRRLTLSVWEKIAE